MILAIKGWPIPMLSDHKCEIEGGDVVSSKIYRTTSWYDARVEMRPSLIQVKLATNVYIMLDLSKNKYSCVGSSQTNPVQSWGRLW